MAAPEAVSFPVFGDLHLGYDSEAWENAAGALRDAISLGPDFLLYTGDLINLSPEHWGLFRRLQTINPGLSLRASRGNADAAAGDDKVWLREIGHRLRSVLDVGHVRVLVLGGVSDDHELPLGPSAGEWLRANAAARPDAVVVVLSHAPLKNTTFWSCDNAESGCLASQLDPTNPPYHLYLLQSAEIAEALAESPNVALFVSGHVHNDHRLRCDHGYGPSCVRDGVVHMVTANLGGWRDTGVDRQEYRWFDITQTAIRARVRDFVGAVWIDELEETYPLRPR